MNKSKNTLEGFTLSMALFDALPVLFFSGTMLCISRHFASKLFLVGALLMVLGGFAKVTWKLLLGLKKGDYRSLNRVFVPLMASGFLLVLLSLVWNLSSLRFGSILAALISFPSVLFFTLGLFLLLVMILLARRFDRRNASDNWKAQLINAAAQGALLLGMLLL